MKKLISKEFVIGASVIVAILVLFFGIEYLKGINLFRPANFYIANYTNVAGLEISAPVSIDGFKVGQVREINFNYDKPGKIEVVFALNKSLRLPEDSKAVIATSLLSGAYVEIKMGKSGKLVDVGGTIEGVTTPDMMASISEQVMPSVSAILPKVDSLLTNLNRLVEDPALSASIQRIDGITADIASATAGLRSVMGTQVPGIMSKAGHVANNLDTITRNLGALSYQLKQLPLNTTMDNVNEITSNLATFSNQLNSANSTLGKLNSDPELYNRLNRVTADIDSLILDIQKNPKRYISIKLL
ncbi:MAG: MlaD family protein [Muribaculaceae bacterium]|nr:MlaD family protein [Muribaculaceae bacterium]MDE5976304.1 MlaD family protein [Muribaculaceae bacterium]